MNQQLVKSLLIEIDASTEKMRRALREGGVELDTFAQKSERSGKTSSTAADAVTSKQANAARAIAMTTETIARQGQVSGETAKQLIAQGSNVAFMFGPAGAIVGAVGIATLAIVGMFARTKREMQEAIDKAREAVNAFSEMDAVGQARAINRLVTGRLSDDAVLGTAEIMERPEDQRAALLRERGIRRLREDEARLLAEARAAATQPPDYHRSRARVEEIRAVREALKDLGAEYDRYNAELEQTAAVEAQRALEVAKVEQGTKAAADAEREREQRAKEAEKRRLQREEQFLKAQDEMHARMRTALRDGITGTSEDVQQAFDEMIAYAQQHGGADVAFLVRARDQALAFNAALERSRELMDRVAMSDLADSIVTTDTRDRSGPWESVIQGLEAERNRFTAIANDIRTTDRERAAALEQVRRIQADIVRLVERESQARRRDRSELIAQAQAIGQMLDGVLQMAGAWGNVRREVIDTLRGVVQIGSNVPNLLDKLDALGAARAAAAAGKAGKGVESVGGAMAGVAGAALPIIGAIASIGSVIFGKSPAEEERKRVQRENTLAIKDLTKRVGSTGIGVSGSNLLGAGAEVAALLRALPASARGNGRLRLNLDEVGQQFDLSLLREVAHELGVTLDGTLGSFIALLGAIEATTGKLGEFGDSLADQTAVNDVLIDARQITDPIERLIAKTSPAAALSPLIGKLLAGADLSTEAGRAALRQQIITILETLQAGGDSLSLEDMGDLQRDEILQVIQQILGGLDEIEGSQPSATSSLGGVSGFRGLTEAAGERMADYLKAILGQGSEHLQLLRLQLAELARIAATPFTLPAIPGVTVPMPAGAGGISITLAAGAISMGDIVVQLNGSTTDPAGLGLQVSRAVRDQVEELLYQSVSRALRARGDVSIIPGVR